MNLLSQLKMAIVVAASIAVTAAASSVEGSTFIFNFSGLGTTGSIVFDDTIPDSNPDPFKGEYLGAISSFFISINGTPESGTGVPTFEILQGASGSVIVGLAADGIGACGVTVNCLAFLLGSTVFPPTDPSLFDLTFDYPAGTFASDALPSVVPPTGEAILRGERQFFLGRAATASVVPAAAVPEPGTWLLLGTGVALLSVFNALRYRPGSV